VIELPLAGRVLNEALAARAFSAATAEVGTAAGAVWCFAGGRLEFGARAEAVDRDTIFDLASLTKVLATTTMALELATSGALDLETPVRRFVSGWSGPERASVTVRDLLEHASGLPGHRPYFREMAGRDAYEAAIAAEALEYPPRSRSIYSDLGFILLGFILEDVASQSLDEQCRRWRAANGLGEPLEFVPPDAWRHWTAATEQDAWRGRLLRGEVHDENAAALGGVAGHAGLFGTAAAVGEIARWWLALLAAERATDRARTAATFVQRSTVPGSSRALGWDTMLPTSSCGTKLSARAIGHTGFTGTSLWIDPARGLYAVLLTNRVHPSRENDRIRAVRRAFHDAIVDDLDAI
jgi:serine-type D-Ala-D-Ala carboxypeptidase